eukprot:PhF_6_TR22571/c0_g1_i1/m.32140/K04460/PPP5C; serine/threonine-protein phosphatase 5
MGCKQSSTKSQPKPATQQPHQQSTNAPTTGKNNNNSLANSGTGHLIPPQTPTRRRSNPSPLSLPERTDTFVHLLTHGSPKTTSVCHRCLVEKPTVREMATHVFSCEMVTCSACNQKVFPCMLKLCPKELIAARSPTRKIKERPRRRDTIKITFPNLKDRHAVTIQQAYRKHRNRKIDDDVFADIFRLIHQDLDKARENATVAKTIDATPAKRKSAITTTCTKNDIPADHYFPKSHDFPITATVVKKMSDDLQKGVRLPYAAAWRILEDAVEVLVASPNINVVNHVEGGKVVVVGDLHGQLRDLLHILASNGPPSPDVCYVFNGDFVDRGSSGMEILLMLFALVAVFPKYVFLNRGNHEASYMNEEYGFDMEVMAKYDRAMFHFIQRVFNVIPLASVVNGEVFVVHGGLPRSESVTLEYINKMERKRVIPFPSDDQSKEDEVFQDLTWADPMPHDGFAQSDRGVSYRFGGNVTHKFLEANNLKYVLRSHEVCLQGFEEMHDGGLYTVFSASDYDGHKTNKAAVAIVRKGADRPRFFTFAADDIEWTTLSFAPGSFYRWSINDHSVEDESSRNGVLRYLRGQIYHKRHRLLKYFTAIDATRKGTVHIVDWVQAMKIIVCATLPWYYLRSVVTKSWMVQRDRNGALTVQYFPFLYQFENVLLSRWVTQWKARVVHKFRQALEDKNVVMSPQLFGPHASDLTVIDYSDLSAVVSHYDTGLTEQEIFQLYNFFDTDSDGYVTVGDVVKSVNQRCTSQERDGAGMWQLDVMQELQRLFLSGKIVLSTLFSSMDKGNTGFLTEESFKKGLGILNRTLQVPLESWQVSLLYECVDKDGDGKISYNDFMESFRVQEEDVVGKYKLLNLGK